VFDSTFTLEDEHVKFEVYNAFWNNGYGRVAQYQGSSGFEVSIQFNLGTDFEARIHVRGHLFAGW
jgi:hypothetical protein